jgi:hypothetical protein
MATPVQINAITALYVGYFDRAPDPAGLQFWIDQIDNGREFNTIAADFAASPEATALYPYLTAPGVASPATFFSSIYQNLFNRAPDAEGLAFWTGVLTDGSVTAADMIEAIINGATGDDLLTLDNKVEVGLDWATAAANTPGFTYDAAAAAAAVAIVDGVTDDAATVAAAKAVTATGVTSVSVGDTFTLTTGVDDITGTGGQDTFQAVASGGAGNTLNIFDSVDGGAGVDTMNLALGGSADNIRPLLDIKNVEIINILRNNDGGTIDASVFGTAAQQLWQVGDADEIENLVEGQTAGFRNTDVDSSDSIAYAAGAVTASVALDNANNSIDLNIDGDDIETVNIAGTQAGPGSADLDVDLGTDGTFSADAVTALNLSLARDTNLVVIGSNGEELETIDASGSTGGITYTLPEAGTTDVYALESITGGSGNDDLTIVFLADLSADTFAVSGGAGNDEMTITNTGVFGGTAIAVNATGGEGADTLRLSDLLNVADASEANFMDSLITFTDFNGDEDVLDIGFDTTTLGTLTNTQRTNIEAEDNLFDALNFLAGLNLGGGTYGFDFGDDAYIYQDGGTVDAFDANDGLVKLAGFSVENFDSSNLV